MATIRRYPVPPESYDPNRPLNDLLCSQFEHFVHVEQHLPEELRTNLPIPSPDDVAAVNRFIAAVTTKLMSVKRRQPLRLVRRPAPRPPQRGIEIPALAASAEPALAGKPKSARGKTAKRMTAHPKSAAQKSRTKSRSKSKATRPGK